MVVSKRVLTVEECLVEVILVHSKLLVVMYVSSLLSHNCGLAEDILKAACVSLVVRK